MRKGLVHLLHIPKRDPESVEFLHWIWRKMQCLQSLRVVVPVAEHWTEVCIDIGYCIDRHIKGEG